MAKITKGYYHCLECDALFEAELKDPSEQRCVHCGNRPTGSGLSGIARAPAPSVNQDAGGLLPRASSKLHGVNQDTQDIYEATKVTMEALKDSRGGHVKRSKRKEHKSKKWMIAVGVWLVLLLAVIGWVKLSQDEGGLPTSTDLSSDEQAERSTSLENEKKRLLIEAAVPACEKVMVEFLMSPSAARKAQYVYHGVKLSGVMERYYRNDINFSATRKKVKILRAELLDGFPKQTMGTLCLDSDGNQWESVFVMDGGEWKVDWEALVRYNTKPWALFLSGSENEEGEFRLYLRVRNTNEDEDQVEWSLILCQPQLYTKLEFDEVLPVKARVPKESEVGRQIESMIELASKAQVEDRHLRKDTHGLVIGITDPPEYYRVKVRLRLHKVGKNKKKTRVELLKIQTFDWYGIESIQKPASTESR